MQDISNFYLQNILQDLYLVYVLINEIKIKEVVVCNRIRSVGYQREGMLQNYQFILLICLLNFSRQIKGILYEESFRQWEKSQVVIYTAKPKVFKTKSFLFRGKCFGNLISTKHVLTIASCILEEKDRLINDKKVKSLIEETRIHRVSK